MSDEDKILAFLQMSGPTTPTKVAKVISQPILLASAHLSDLISRKKVRISYLKIGGSPLYYLPGQEAQLYPFAAGNINPKDQQVLESLKEKKVLWESTLELLPRVALRSLKDFAVPLQVNLQGKAELFWKWHLLSDQEADKMIGQMVQNVPHGEMPASLSMEQQLLLSDQPVPKAVVELPPQVPPPATLPQTAPEIQEEKTERKARKKPMNDTFLPQLEEFFISLKIIIEQKETLRKSKEIDFLVRVPSAVGKMKYFCKAKHKQKCDEKDLSAAYMESLAKKLPLLFLYTGELSKKAQEMLDSGAFENVIVKKVE